jgi:hypothetical protein
VAQLRHALLQGGGKGGGANLLDCGGRAGKGNGKQRSG